ncbi:hypothetical protein ACFU51_14765 [Streptomyces sp. NPDC057430]|uniref:hypothetical protein n=1 Tax=Streptomyces sp. NPDC057430 TaxID=3346131 RepID=UPI0036ABA090
MEPITLTLRTLDGDPIATVQAQPTSTLGLVTYRTTDPGRWHLAHHSGLAIAEFTTDRMAMSTASYLGAMADWTLSAEELRSTPNLMQKVATVVFVADGVLLLNPDDNTTATN